MVERDRAGDSCGIEPSFGRAGGCSAICVGFAQPTGAIAGGDARPAGHARLLGMVALVRPVFGGGSLRKISTHDAGSSVAGVGKGTAVNCQRTRRTACDQACTCHPGGRAEPSPPNQTGRQIICPGCRDADSDVHRSTAAGGGALFDAGLPGVHCAWQLCGAKVDIATVRFLLCWIWLVEPGMDVVVSGVVVVVLANL